MDLKNKSAVCVKCGKIKLEGDSSSSGRPILTKKLTVFNAACIKLEENIDLYTVSEFYEMMQTFGEEIYSLKMTQNKLKEKYGDSMQLVVESDNYVM